MQDPSRILCRILVNVQDLTQDPIYFIGSCRGSYFFLKDLAQDPTSFYRILHRILHILWDLTGSYLFCRILYRILVILQDFAQDPSSFIGSCIGSYLFDGISYTYIRSSPDYRMLHTGSFLLNRILYTVFLYRGCCKNPG